jgi:hypothetical protein
MDSAAACHAVQAIRLFVPGVILFKPLPPLAVQQLGDGKADLGAMFGSHLIGQTRRTDAGYDDIHNRGGQGTALIPGALGAGETIGESHWRASDFAKETGQAMRRDRLGGNQGIRRSNDSHVSLLGGPEVFGEKVWTEAKRRGWQQAVDTQVVSDGAAWIWNLVGTYLYDAHQVVDWYDATEHLGLAAHLVFGEGSPEALHWLKQQETPLFQGHADQVAQTITNLANQAPAQEELLKQAGYFTNHHHRMQYLEMRSEGWLIGSGVVESGGKRFKDRFARAGMRWSRMGAERLLPVRSAIMSRRFDARWKIAYNSPPI